MKAGAVLGVAAAGLAIGAAVVVIVLNRLDETPPGDRPASTEAAAVARGQTLATIGHCAGCHTARGGAPFAGGRAIVTPFGSLHAPNLTPDPATGLGRWSEGAFWRALHNGRSADGRLLVPACPYPNFTQVARADTNDLFAYLSSLPPVVQPNRPHELRFPFGTQAALALWRAAWFRPMAPPHDAAREPAWNRGAYLVGGLAHCSACHGRHNAWGATDGALDFRGGAIPMQGWVAPALDDPAAAGVQRWTQADVVALLAGGRNAHASVVGPMAMVVAGSTQHWPAADLDAAATFLRGLPERRVPPGAAAPPPAATMTLGERIYERHCAACHGDRGEGAPPMAPALAGNRALTQDPPVNVMRVVLGGAFGPATAANPRPFGMPPFATLLGDDEIAAVVSFLRASWGHRASAVGAADVNRQRGS